MTRSRYRVVVSVEAVVDMTGTRQTFLFSTEDWRTAPTDTPASTPVRGLLASAGKFSRSLFQGGGVTGRITPDYGYVRMKNPRPDRNGAGELDAWAGYSISGCSIEARRGRVGAAYPDEYQVLYLAKGLNLQTGDEITLRLRDESELLDQPIVTAGFAGTGGLEGTGAVPKRKQFCHADPGLFEPIAIDAVNGIYFLHAGSDGGLRDAYLTSSAGALVAPFDVFVKGIKQTRGAHYTSALGILGTPPAAGEVRYWFGEPSAYLPSWRNGPIYFRLGTPAPVSDVRVAGYGGPTDSDHELRGGAAGSLFASHLALRAGVPRDRVDLTGLDLYVGQQLVDDDRTYADVLTDAALALQGWFGFNRLGVFKSGYLLDPADDGYFYGVDPTLFGSPPAAQATTSAYTFTEQRVLRSSVKRVPIEGLESPVWSWSITAGDCWPCTTDDAADATIREYLARQVWASGSGVSEGTRLADPGAGHMTVAARGRYVQNAFSLRLMLERLAVLYGGRHHCWQWSVLIDDELPDAILDLDLHQVVTLQLPYLGLSSGIKLRIVAMEIDPLEGKRITFTGWGGSKGSLTPGATSGGGSGSGGSGGSSSSTVAAAVALIEDFTGVMYGSVSGGGSAGAAGSADTIDDFGGQIVGRVIDDANFASVVLLMHCDTESPAWVDSSMLAAALTESGTITASTSSPLVGTASMVPGTNGKVNTPTALVYNMGSGDLTVECTVVLTATPSSERLFEIGGTGIQIWFNGSTTAPTVLAFGGTVFTASALSTSTTYHLALVKSGTTYTLYANGTSIGSGTRAGSDDGTTNRTITVGNFDSATQPAVSCKLDEIRVTKGVARYTGTFTPPTTPYPGL